MEKKTRITKKYQTSIPKDVRKFLRIKPGEEIEWHIAKGMVVVLKNQKMKNPVDFLTSQITLDIDAVELVKKSRDDFG
jgi:AbrB family looped-hinge helix DNA binding protein